MTRRIRLLIAIGLVGVLAVDIGYAFLLQRYEIQHYTKDTQAHEKNQPNPEGPFLILGRAAVVGAENFTIDKPEAITALATLVIAFFTWRLWWSTDKLWAETKAAGITATIAANAAKKSADASLVALRPWLSCKVEIAEPLTYTTAGDALFAFRFIVKNVGRSPAMGVRLSPDLTLFSPKHEHSIINLQRMAEHNRGMPAGGSTMIIPGGISIVGSELGLLLFPDETYTFNYRIPLKRSEIEKSCEDISTKHFWPELRGLVTYTYPLATVRADTGFVYRIEKLGGVLELGEPVPLENMSLSDHSLWSGFAT